jgi:aminopeptidase
MLSDFEQNLEKYAQIVVKMGLNLQPGQRLLIGSPMMGIYGTPIELVPLVRVITRQAYQAGARLVDVMWNDDQLRLARFQHAPRDSFDAFPAWRAEAALEIAQAADATLIIYAEDPGLLAGQDPQLKATALRTNAEHMGPVSTLRSQNKMNWLIITAPVDDWTEKVFPGLSLQEGTARFWDTIFDICRVKEPDPVAAWREHVDQLVAWCDYLNRKQYTALELTGPGTDLIVGLPQAHVWRGGRLTTQGGITFVPNLPTEEVFALPHKDRVEGVVTATKPLSYGGTLIEGLSLTFSDGQVVEMEAEKGEESLQNLLETDAGSRRLGEVALVPHSSPISQSGLLFYNILIDENASSHLALGRAFKFSIKNGEGLSDAEFAALGGNNSIVHVDFMVGSGEMDIDGVTDGGSVEPVMRAGEWAFEV